MADVLRHDLDLADVLVLSTCNRTEVYYTAAQSQRTGILQALGQVKGVADALAYKSHFITFDSAEAAAQHLFEVALDLNAQVVGDPQISHQVKRAYQRAAAAGAAGPFLHRLLHAVLAANKRVQRETAFRDGAASTSYATLELVQELTAAVARPRVLLVGLGEMGADVCRHFAKSKRFADVTICNRTQATAHALAAECGVAVLDFAQLAQGLQDADVIISALAAPTPFFTHQLLASRNGGPASLLTSPCRAACRRRWSRCRACWYTTSTTSSGARRRPWPAGWRPCRRCAPSSPKA